MLEKNPGVDHMITREICIAPTSHNKLAWYIKGAIEDIKGHQSKIVGQTAVEQLERNDWEDNQPILREILTQE